MAKISKPSSKRKGKGAPPKEEISVTHNLIKESSGRGEVTTLNFRVPKTFKKEFKQFAFDHDISMVELLMKSFKNYKGEK